MGVGEGWMGFVDLGHIGENLGMGPLEVWVRVREYMWLRWDLGYDPSLKVTGRGWLVDSRKFIGFWALCLLRVFEKFGSWWWEVDLETGESVSVRWNMKTSNNEATRFTTQH
ncbi:hypothetical protein ACFE04_022093 [Oxalis oulophora]